jgi:lipopolysaccharide export system protein LptA
MPYLRTGYMSVLVALSTLLFLVVAPACAGKVKVSGEQLAVVDIATGTFWFDGPVTVTDGSTVIRGTKLIYHKEEDSIQFLGDVTIEQNGTSLSGHDLTYDLAKGEGAIQDALASTMPAGAVSPVFVMGEKVTTCSERTLVEGARLTTCDPAGPGYYLASRRIEIIPGERLVLYNVTFVESGMTLFYWPRVTFSLRRADPNAASEEVVLPRIGYSTTEGWYVKSSFGYRGPGEQRGRILVDYMQLLGWGFGVNHTLRADRAGSEKLLVYAQPNRNTGCTDLQLSLTEERTLPGGLQLLGSSTFSSTSSEGEQLSYENRISLTQARKGGSSSFNYSDTRLSGVEKGYEMTGDLAHSQAYEGGWRLRLSSSVDKRNRTDATPRNLIGYVAEAGRETAEWGFDLTAEDRFNPDLAEEIPPEITWSRAQRLPELRLRLKKVSLGERSLPFEADASWGRLTEDRRASFDRARISSHRMHVAVKVKPLQLRLGPLGTIQWSGSATRRTYGTGDRQWVAAERSQYRLPITKSLSLSGDYHYDQVFGDVSPFHFDRIADEEEVQARLDYRSDSLGLFLSGGYDLLNSLPTDVVGNIRVQSAHSKIQAQAAYSIVDADWIYVIGTAQYVPNDQFSLQLGARYNVQMQRADRADALFQWDLDGWKLRYAGIFDGIDQEFELGDFTITRDLGCRAVDLRYNQSRKEVWLEYRITAFPDASLKVGATEKHLMFDARGWEEVLAME